MFVAHNNSQHYPLWWYYSIFTQHTFYSFCLYYLQTNAFVNGEEISYLMQHEIQIMLVHFRTYIIYVNQTYRGVWKIQVFSLACHVQSWIFFAEVAVQKEVSGAALEVGLTVSCQTCEYTFVKSTSEYTLTLA